jgi:hypothetical protein
MLSGEESPAADIHGVPAAFLFSKANGVTGKTNTAYSGHTQQTGR